MSASSSSIRSERTGFGSDLASSASSFSPETNPPSAPSGDGDEHVIADHILGDQPARNHKEDRLGFDP